MIAGAALAEVRICCGSAGEEAGGREDGDVVPGMEVEEVVVAGEDEAGVAAEGELQEFIVAWVAADGDGVGDFDEVHCGEEKVTALDALFDREIVIELRAARTERSSSATGADVM